MDSNVTGLDIENHSALIPYLRNKGLLGNDDPLEVRTLTGGVSNRTVLVSASPSHAFVVKQALAKLRVKADWHSDPSRIHKEALGLCWLEKLAPKGTTTPLLFEDHQDHVIAMAAVEEPHDNWKSLLLRGEVESDHVKQFADLLATVHVASAHRASELRSVFGDRVFFETLRLEPYYRYSAEQVPVSSDFLNSLIQETLAQHISLVHGDYSPKNILIHARNLILLDHEVIHFGDPAFDLGFSLTHLLSKARHCASFRQRFLQASHVYVEQYAAAVDEEPWWPATEPRAVRHVLGCLLARVAGRSPLEYLTPQEAEEQVSMVLSMMQKPPQHLSELIQSISESLYCPL